MSVVRHEIRRGAYYDSVVLMQLQRGLAELPGVVDAGVVMATPANMELLDSSNLLSAGAEEAGADDLLIVVKAEDDAAAGEAMGQVDELLKRRRRASEQQFRPRSLASALKMLPDARWVLISVPGRYAAGVAREALQAGRHVFLYSDNVALEDEVALKETARQNGLLLMGPDCGTAIVNGTGLGFANRIRQGKIGLVGASGTGLQAITSEIHRLGGGISAAIGTGGRDLSPEVGGVTASQGLDLLAQDPDTGVIVLVSKPPDPEVVARLLATAQATEKPVVVSFLGYPVVTRQLGNLHFALNLSDAASLAVKLQFQADETRDPLSVMRDPSVGSRITDNGSRISGYLRGLFSGGTLAYEALLSLQPILHPLYSNTPLRESQQLRDVMHSQGHTIFDLGADEFTQGRLHPMMDNDLRLRRLHREAADPEVGLILLDVVLGEGAHPDPAAELAPAIAEVKASAKADGRSLEVGAIVVGTDEDPQGLEAQIEQLELAGAMVFRDVTSAATAIVGALVADDGERQGPPVPRELLEGEMVAVNVGLESFYDSVSQQGGTAVHVDWRPPAGGNEKMMALLAKLKERS